MSVGLTLRIKEPDLPRLLLQIRSESPDMQWRRRGLYGAVAGRLAIEYKAVTSLGARDEQ